MAAGGGLIRDYTGKLLSAFCTRFPGSSSFEAELLALLQGLILARSFSTCIWIELDAAAVVSLLSSEGFGPAKTRNTVAHIRLLLKDIQVRITHIHREDNRTADSLANRGCHSQSLEIFDEGSLPRNAAALVRMDQLGLPNFRFRYVDR